MGRRKRGMDGTSAYASLYYRAITLHNIVTQRRFTIKALATGVFPRCVINKLVGYAWHYACAHIGARLRCALRPQRICVCASACVNDDVTATRRQAHPADSNNRRRFLLRLVYTYDEERFGPPRFTIVRLALMFLALSRLFAYCATRKHVFVSFCAEFPCQSQRICVFSLCYLRFLEFFLVYLFAY